MGREIRRVPPNWEHPRKPCTHSPWAGGCDDAKKHGGKCYQPLFDEPFGPAMDAWYENWKKWEAGTFDYPSYCDAEDRKLPFWEWDSGPPDPEYYRPAWDESTATWYQMYQTVSEGSPVTPPFATKEELIDYLVKHGDFWDQSRGHGAWSRENATRFVESAWAPSMIIADGKAIAPRDGGLPKSE